MSAKTVSSLLKKYRIRPNKRMGQNFLKEPGLIGKIVDALELYPDEDILEIGSGVGVLTGQLAREALEVIAVEKDNRLLKIAREESEDKKNIKFIHADFLKLNLSSLLQNYRLPMKVVGNIPYYISSKVLFKLLENRSLFQCAVLTLQKEVAARLSAPIRTKDYGILTIQMGLHAECKKLFDIEPGAFFPAPQVTSTVVKITYWKQSPYVLHNPAFFQKMIVQAFCGRRKTIKNTLKSLLKNGKIKPWEMAQIDPSLRPEQITIAQYVGLANILSTLL